MKNKHFEDILMFSNAFKMSYFSGNFSNQHTYISDVRIHTENYISEVEPDEVGTV